MLSSQTPRRAISSRQAVATMAGRIPETTVDRPSTTPTTSHHGLLVRMFWNGLRKPPANTVLTASVSQ